MSTENAKKTNTSKLRVHSKKSHSPEEGLSEEEEEENESNDPDYVSESEGDHEEDDEAPSGEEASATDDDIQEGSVSPAKALLKHKQNKDGKMKEAAARKRPRKEEHDEEEEERPKRIKKPEAKPKPKPKPKEDEEEIKHEASASQKEDKKAGKKEPLPFNDRNVDVDLFHSSPNNVKPLKVKVSNNLIVTCRHIDQVDGARSGGLTYDFAALTFQRKTNNDKMFEFVVPLSSGPRIQEAIVRIIEHNPKFFTKTQ